MLKKVYDYLREYLYKYFFQVQVFNISKYNYIK